MAAPRVPLPWLRPGVRLDCIYTPGPEDGPRPGTVLARCGNHTVSILWDGWPQPVVFDLAELPRLVYRRATLLDEEERTR